MTVLRLVLASPLAAAVITAAALLLQAWWQRRTATRQRRDDQAHELAMAQERHRAELERLEREAALRVREAGHERLVGLHQGLLTRLDALAMAVSGAITSMHRLAPEDQVKMGMHGFNISQDYGALMDAERAVRVFAGKDAVAAAMEAVKTGSALVQAGLFAESPPGMTLAQYTEHYRTFHAARERYREALRVDIGAA